MLSVLFLVAFAIATSGGTTTTKGNLCQLYTEKIMCGCDASELEGAKAVNCYVTKGAELSTAPEIWERFKTVQKVKSLLFTSVTANPMSFVPLLYFESSWTALQGYKQTDGNLPALPSFSGVELPHLTKLELERNNIEEIEENAFAKLPKLSILSLSENKLSALKSSFFTGLANLEELYLDRNQITSIADDTFTGLPALMDLQLSSNLIEQFTSKSFSGLYNLKHLDLFRNKIRKIPSGAFRDSSTLRELDLKENLIEELEPRAFEGLRLLQYLQLSKNKLKSVTGPLWKDCKHLREIDFSNNKLEIMSSEVILDLEQAKEEFFHAKLQENPWICSCEILWMVELGNTAKNKMFSKELNHTLCRIEDDSRFNLRLSDKVKIAFFAAQEPVAALCGNVKTGMKVPEHLTLGPTKATTAKTTEWTLTTERTKSTEGSTTTRRYTSAEKPMSTDGANDLHLKPEVTTSIGEGNEKSSEISKSETETSTVLTSSVVGDGNAASNPFTMTSVVCFTLLTSVVIAL